LPAAGPLASLMAGVGRRQEKYACIAAARITRIDFTLL